ncbi:hypothetical protein ACTQZS_08135 [Bilifractor sp. LCP19S3_H10]|uniref:hypothetical protein n=1 Tax=Bilifractor sp. LCP19S3_H10 TaxID=3438736 RepID=UPI003F8D9B37
MIKIIKGRRYDTEKAKAVAHDERCSGSFSDWSETLYRKQTGEYFLYGEGGPMTKYAQATGDNSWSGGEQIIPLSFESAQEWAEEHLDGEEYEKLFGIVEEDNPGTKSSITIRLTDAAIAKLSDLAAAGETTKSNVIEKLILGR